MLIEFDREVDVEWVTQKLLQMEWWMAAPCHLECVLVGDEERPTVQERKLGGSRDRPRVG